MLVLTRRVGEALMIGDGVTVTVLGVRGNQVTSASRPPARWWSIAKRSTGASGGNRNANAGPGPPGAGGRHVRAGSAIRPPRGDVLPRLACSGDRDRRRSHGERITPERLRELHVAASWRDDVLGRAGPMFPSMSAPLRARLTASLRQTLSRWLDADDRIGHALPVGPDEYSSAASNGPLWDVQYVSSLKSFADGIVQGAAVLGAERVCSLLADWGRGSPVPVRIVGVLDRLPVDRTVAPGRGIRIDPLPAVSDDLPAWLPDKPGLLDFAYLGRTLVSVEAEAAPALFRPEDPTASTGAVRMTLKRGSQRRRCL